MTDFSRFDKEVYYVKLTLGEACTMNCKYCFVDKEKKTVMSYETMKNFIDFLMYTPGEEKVLHILGGETLLFMHLLKKAVPYARELEQITKKKLDISFCTNGMLYSDEVLEFGTKYDIKFAWSIDGPPEIHDMNRILKSGGSAYEQTVKHKNLVFEKYDSRSVGIGMTVSNHEKVVTKLFESFLYLYKIEGFDTFNLAPVDGIEGQWQKNPESIRHFLIGFAKVHEYLLREIEAGNFFYLISMNKELRMNWYTRKNIKGMCPWYTVDGWQNGEIIFTPFIQNHPSANDFILANINSPTFFEDIAPYMGCSFERRSDTCGKCNNDYFGKLPIEFNPCIPPRDALTIKYANIIRERAKTDERYAKYIESAIEHMYI